MSKKLSRNERRKAARAVDASASEAGSPTPGEIVRRRRNKRVIFLAIVAVLLPLLEVAAYQFRSILIVVVNDSDESVKDVKVSYPGGSFEAAELKPGAELTHSARPSYSFTKNDFSTYRTTISLRLADGGFVRQMGRAGTVDYSARETYSIQPDPANNNVVGIKHTTHPGFPLGTIRDLLTKMGVR